MTSLKFLDNQGIVSSCEIIKLKETKSGNCNQPIKNVTEIEVTDVKKSCSYLNNSK